MITDHATVDSKIQIHKELWKVQIWEKLPDYARLKSPRSESKCLDTVTELILIHKRRKGTNK